MYHELKQTKSVINKSNHFFSKFSFGGMESTLVGQVIVGKMWKKLPNISLKLSSLTYFSYQYNGVFDFILFLLFHRKI